MKRVKVKNAKPFTVISDNETLTAPDWLQKEIEDSLDPVKVKARDEYLHGIIKRFNKEIGDCDED